MEYHLKREQIVLLLIATDTAGYGFSEIDWGSTVMNRKESDLVEEEQFSHDIFGRMNLKIHLLSRVWIKRMVEEKER